MTSATATAAGPAGLDQIIAKENWTAEDCRQLYQALFGLSNAADKFRGAANRLLADNPQPTGAAAIKAGIVQYMLGRFEPGIQTLAAGTDNKDRRWYQAQCYKQLAQY
jgi:hypothetical protein